MCLSASLKTKLFCETSSIFELDNIRGAAILRDFLKFWTWQRQKRSYSARPQFFKLTTSKTKQFCETSLKNGNLSAGLTASCHCVLRFFPLHLCKALRLPRKSDARSYEVLHLSRKIISANLKIWCSKMQLLSGNQRPDLLTSLSYRACHAKCIFPDPLQMSHACDRFWKCYKTLTVWSLLARCRIPCACNAKPHLNVEKWSETVSFLHFASTCASRHNGVRTACTFSTCQLPKVLRELVCLVHFDFEMCFFTHNGARFFDISTSKSGPSMRCFVQFDLEISFAPQRHAVFHLSSPQMALPL